MTPFKALDSRVCRSTIRLFKEGDVKPLDVNLVKEVQEKI